MGARMTERVQKIIAAAGLMSRRAAEERIAQGRVTVNGQVIGLGDRADPEQDTILVDGRRLPRGGERVYILLNKPRGYVTTLHDEKGRRNVAELVKDVGVRLYPVGRLDMDSEGLLIMTNDGDFANRLMHPSHQVDKTYHTWVEGRSLEQALPVLRSAMVIDGQRIRPARVELLKETEEGAVLSITIHEGRNRQIRKMCEKAGLQVTRLCRVAEGSLRLGKLPTGQWRTLSEKEIKELGKQD